MSISVHSPKNPPKFVLLLNVFKMHSIRFIKFLKLHQSPPSNVRKFAESFRIGRYGKVSLVGLYCDYLNPMAILLQT
jgi:hypothetical protein